MVARGGDFVYPSAMLKPEVLAAAGNYLVEHPRELLRLVRNAALLRFGVPLAALRWVATRAGGQRAPTDVEIEAVPPGVRVGATLELMGARLRASGIVFVEGVQLGPEELRVELRFADVRLTLLNESDSPIAALIRSGALDLTKLGNLVSVMPRRPKFLVEAKGDRVVLDLKRHPAFAGQRVETIVSLLTPLITVTGVSTDVEHLDVEFGVFQRGVAAALASWRALL